MDYLHCFFSERAQSAWKAVDLAASSLLALLRMQPSVDSTPRAFFFPEWKSTQRYIPALLLLSNY
jgi:hypothetical protein